MTCLAPSLEDRQFEWRIARRRAVQFGLRHETPLPPMDGEQARAAHERLTSDYWRGHLTKEEAKAEALAIDLAAESYFVRGVVAHMPGKRTRQKQRAALIERDGYDCWLCGKRMHPNDRSIEHLTARMHGGADDLDNLVLCHGACNHTLGTLSREQKEILRVQLMKGEPVNTVGPNGERL